MTGQTNSVMLADLSADGLRIKINYNINILWGVVLLIFGLLMLFFSLCNRKG